MASAVPKQQLALQPQRCSRAANTTFFLIFSYCLCVIIATATTFTTSADLTSKNTTLTRRPLHKSIVSPIRDTNATLSSSFLPSGVISSSASQQQQQQQHQQQQQQQRCAGGVIPPLMNHTNIPGGGYKNFICDTPITCAHACCSDVGCAAFTWISHANSNGTTRSHNCTRGARCCFLKTGQHQPPSHHQPGSDTFTVSGIVVGPSPPAPSPPPVPPLPPSPPAPPNAKNVLLFIADDMRPELNTLGYERTHMYTPHLQALAARSLVMTQAFVQQALCGPSRASFMVGRRPDTLRTVTHKGHCANSRGPSCYWRDVAPGNYTSLPQYFRQHGYYTASYGKVFDPRTSDNCDAHLSWSQAPVLCSCTGTNIKTNRASHLAVAAAQESQLIDVAIAKGAVTFLQNYPSNSGSASSSTSHSHSHNRPTANLHSNASVLDNTRQRTTDSAGSDAGGVLAGGAGTSGSDGETQPRPFFLAVGFHRPHLPFVVPERHLQHYPPSLPAAQPPTGYKQAGLGVPRMGWTGSNELRA
eukprot:UC1_evm1s1466